MCNSSCAFAARCADGSILSVSTLRVQKVAREKKSSEIRGIFSSQVSAVFNFHVLKDTLYYHDQFHYIPRCV